MIFDGTTRLGEALAIILHFGSESWTLERLVRIQLLSKSMTGGEIARELIRVISANYDIDPNQLIAAMRDRAAVNGVAVRTVAVVYPKALDIGCFSHTIDRVGEHFKTPILSFLPPGSCFFLIVPKQNYYGKSKLQQGGGADAACNLSGSQKAALLKIELAGAKHL